LTTDTPATFIPAEPPSSRRRRGRRRRGRAVLAVILVIAAVAGAAWWWRTNMSIEPAATVAGPAATAAVERGTISATDELEGTLEYAEPYSVRSSAEGVVTWLFPQNKTVKQGDRLYRINEEPVILLYGAVPTYRDLGPGDSGKDVKQLEQNLVKLGYKGFTVDDDYSSATADAVREWQDDIGAEETGRVARGAVVFVPGGRRVDALRVGVGDAVRPGQPILDITATGQTVSLEVGVEDRDLVDIGTSVMIVLPDDKEVAGRVTSMVVEEVPDEAAAGGEGTPTTIAVAQAKITPAKRVPDELVGVTVKVVVAIAERKDVLLVPVNALLALAEGKYGLEVVGEGGSRSIVPVTTGLFADGKVEVKGDGLAEGTIVGVAGR
jgi:peptidoglycan hydrolase-like protein with peptidoglycan-binding domain